MSFLSAFFYLNPMHQCFSIQNDLYPRVMSSDKCNSVHVSSVRGDDSPEDICEVSHVDSPSIESIV